MNKLLIQIYSIFALIVFVFSIALFIGNTYQEYSGGDERASALFNTYANELESAPENASALRKINDDQNIIALRLEKNGGTLCIKNGAYSFDEKPTSMIKSFSRQIVKDSDSYVFSAAFYKLRPEIIFQNAKVSFLIILACTILTAILLLIVSQSDSDTEETENTPAGKKNTDDKKEEENNREAEQTANEISSSDDSFSTAGQEPQTDEEEERKPELPQTESPLAQESEESEAQAEAQTEQDAASDIQMDIFPAEEEKIEIKTLEEKPVSPLVAKLNELMGDGNPEISLFLVDTKGNNAEDSSITDIVKNALTADYFSNALVFDFTENVFAAIKEGFGIDEAEDFASEFHRALTEKCAERQLTADINVGISSTATRKMPAERLVTEAHEALNHALSEADSQIIGFHVDIEKYNEFIEKN